MATIFEYLEWRGDLILKQASFNPVDALILSRLSFLPFERVWDEASPPTVGQAAQSLLAQEDIGPHLHMARDKQFMTALVQSRRFSDMPLSAYVNEVDTGSQKQFSAVCISMSKDEHFISYRGTDNTLVGWKEDFNMTFLPSVPSQRDAAVYLERAAARLPGRLRLGGHSKGGNLAVYAAAFCPPELRERIIAVYNNDGPGFNASVISQPGYQAVRQSLHTFVPQTSIVGMLMDHEEEYTIVQSRQKGLMQHDLYSWEVRRDGFICLDTVSSSSRFIDRTLKDWLSGIEPHEREQWLDNIYHIFSETEVGSVKELTANWYKNAGIVLRSLKGMDDDFKRFTMHLLRLLIRAAKQNMLMLRTKDRV